MGLTRSSMSATPNPLQASFKTPDNVPLQQPGQLELRILTSSVGPSLYPPPNVDSDALAISALTAQPPPNTTSSDFIRLLSGPLNDFLLYSHRKQSNWLIDIAHDICDPTAKRGLLRIWTGQEWKIVARQDRLKASVYRYDVPEGVVISLSKISARRARSITSASGNASTMADRVKDCDEQCWVTSGVPVINSHVCPKRMGDHLAGVVFDTFVSTPRPATLSIYDERFGIALIPSLDFWFDKYELGLRFVSTNSYECHSFPPPTMPTNRIRTILTDELRPISSPVLHGCRVRPPHPEKANNPPAGLFRWHYLQCVIKKFGHPDYTGLPDIGYMELPLRMEGDSDDEGTDPELEWPSALFDRGRYMQATIERHEERQRLVADWITTVK
ncbi:hypothetical protein BC827DRAFT_570726 [Russula dissimulans]|nr:hypothetical protein BC827DRAFT_570726 [Russula dissimulans]